MKKKVIILLLMVTIILVTAIVFFFYEENEEIKSENGNGLAMTSSGSNLIGNRYNGLPQGTMDGNISNATLDNGTVTINSYEIENTTNITNTTKNSNENNRNVVTNIIENQQSIVINNNFSKEDEIFIQIDQSTLSNNSATVIVENKKKNLIQYTDDYIIEKKENYDWIKMQQKNIESTSTVVKKTNNEIIEIKVNWKNRYGDLEKGTYRIVKNINNILFFAEFCI